MKIEYVGHKIIEQIPSYTRISWNMVKHCNYNCWYCYDEDDKRSVSDHLDLSIQTVKNVVANINHAYYNSEYIKIVCTGGEPTTLNYLLFEYVEYLLCNVHNIKELILHTNTSKNIKYFIDLNKKFSSFPIEVNCTLHLDYIDDNTIDDFIAKVAALENIKKYVWIMIGQNNEGRAIRYRDKINRYFGYSIANYKYIQHPSTWDFISRHKMDVIDDKKNIVIATKSGKEYCNVDQLMLDNKNRYKGMICMRGTNQLSIQSNGNVYLSDCDWYKMKSAIKTPGIREKDADLSILHHPTICQSEYCKHPSDNYIPKYSIEYYIANIDKFIHKNIMKDHVSIC